MDDPEPWPEEVDGGELLNELVQTLRKFVAMEDPAFTATALWILHAHAHDAAFISPLLAIMSPEKRCGKTTLLHLIGPMVPRPLTTSNITSAALFRAVEKYRPTLLVDEADSFLRDKEELRGVLNSGQSKATAFVIRTVGDDHEPRRFSTWAPKVVALIGNLPDTLEDRSIVIPMRRRAPEEVLEKLRLEKLEGFIPFQRKAWRWTRDHLEDLKNSDPPVSEKLNDRATDNWRPLFAIADLAGGEWPRIARDAALVLSGGEELKNESAGVLLLRDIRTIF